MTFHSKYCVMCQKEQNIDNFYKAGKYHQTNCKSCHNGCRLKYPCSYTKKPNNFQKLDKDIQSNIINDLKTKSCRQISMAYNINYRTFLNWHTRGIIC